MKEYLAEMIRELSPWEGSNLAREYLQAQVLAAMQRAGAMVSLAFCGGTALRFLYGIPRYSEDLDFCLEGEPDCYDLGQYARAIRHDLERQAYAVEVAVDERRTMHSAWVRLPGLPFELGLSPHRTQRLAIKIEVDTRPPAGAGIETTLVRRHVILRLQHHDRASLLAGKLHAILQRPYTKGRDLYDLLWYLSDRDWPSPNLTLLNNALEQTGWEGARLSDASWPRAVDERIAALDWDAALRDVRPFLPPDQSALLTHENLHDLLVLRMR